MRLIIAVIIIAAVLFLFGQARVGGAQLVGSGAGAQRPGPANPRSALPPGYRSEGPNSGYGG